MDNYGGVKVGNGKMTITDVAERLGVTTKTIVRWEKTGKVARAKRDWRGWRVYEKGDLRKLRQFKETIVCFEGDERNESLQKVF